MRNMHNTLPMVAYRQSHTISKLLVCSLGLNLALLMGMRSHPITHYYSQMTLVCLFLLTITQKN